MTLDQLLELRWTIQTEARHDDGDYYVVRVKELPGMVATGETPEELEAAFWSALREHLQNYLDHGEMPPIPVKPERPSDFVPAEEGPRPKLVFRAETVPA